MAWKWHVLRDRELVRAGRSYKALNRRQLDEEATAILLEDCHSGDRPGAETKAYRKQYGIIFPEQLFRIHNREYLIDTMDMHHHGQAGMYNRSHPEGRTIHTPEQRARGMSYYA